EGRTRGALERTADAGGATDAGRSDPEPLQFRGGYLVADVERLGDERCLLQLLLLDTGERPVSGEPAAGCGGDQLGVDLLAGDRERSPSLRLALASFCPAPQSTDALKRIIESHL